MLPVLSIGPLSLPVSPLVMLIGFWIGSSLSQIMARHSNIDPKPVDNLLWLSLAAGLIGARVSYIARNPWAFHDNFIAFVSLNPNLLDPLGGSLIGLTAGYVYISKNHLNPLKILDTISPFFITMLIAGNLSFFASGKYFGLPTDFPLGIYLWGVQRHPVQLYLAGSGTVILLIIFKIQKMNIRNSGRLFLFSAAMISGTYLFLTGFQKPTFTIANGIRLSQIVYWICLALCLLLLSFHPMLKQSEGSDGPQQ